VDEKIVLSKILKYLATSFSPMLPLQHFSKNEKKHPMNVRIIQMGLPGSLPPWETRLGPGRLRLCRAASAKWGLSVECRGFGVYVLPFHLHRWSGNRTPLVRRCKSCSVLLGQALLAAQGRKDTNWTGIAGTASNSSFAIGPEAGGAANLGFFEFSCAMGRKWRALQVRLRCWEEWGWAVTGFMSRRTVLWSGPEERGFESVARASGLIAGMSPCRRLGGTEDENSNSSSTASR